VKILGLFGKPAMQHVRKSRMGIHQEARSTSDKIDAIESELSAEFGTLQWLPTQASADAGKDLPELSQCLDEAALLFTNHQINAARDLLLRARTLPGDASERRQIWWMLLELALEQNQPEFFDEMALDYAHVFETSPPQWKSPTDSLPDPNGALPIINFRGKLTGNSLPALRQLQQAGSKHSAFCVEFGTIAEADPDGCALLLQVLAHWQCQHCRFSIASGDLLTDTVKPLILSGRRDDNDAAWRLLIEMMRLMNRHAEHEALCIDYCLTYEVSPPSDALAEHTALNGMTRIGPASTFLLPAHIALPVDELLAQLQRYSHSIDSMALDAHRLVRLELSAAAPWLNGLHRIAGGKPVECRNIGFLVARLLTLVGGNSPLTLIHRKP
jgi:ABC-type transporter Mla MlaB component